jgi:hypothetical protein
MIRSASLDSSFWNIASQIGLTPYLFSYFKVYYCRAVEQEIVTTDPNETPLIYPQAMLFQVLREDGRLHRHEPEKPLTIFGVGAVHGYLRRLTNTTSPALIAQAEQTITHIAQKRGEGL